jgi:hypothetical protein
MIDPAHVYIFQPLTDRYGDRISNFDAARSAMAAWLAFLFVAIGTVGKFHWSMGCVVVVCLIVAGMFIRDVKIAEDASRNGKAMNPLLAKRAGYRWAMHAILVTDSILLILQVSGFPVFEQGLRYGVLTTISEFSWFCMEQFAACTRPPPKRVELPVPKYMATQSGI